MRRRTAAARVVRRGRIVTRCRAYADQGLGARAPEKRARGVNRTLRNAVGHLLAPIMQADGKGLAPKAIARAKASGYSRRLSLVLQSHCWQSFVSAQDDPLACANAKQPRIPVAKQTAIGRAQLLDATTGARRHTSSHDEAAQRRAPPFTPISARARVPPAAEVPKLAAAGRPGRLHRQET